MADRLHRTLLLVAGASYLGWWGFVHFTLPDAFNPIGSRVAVVLGFFAVAWASTRFEAIAHRLDLWLALCCSVATAHYFYLFDRNNGDLNWVVGSYITITAVCAILQTSRALISYSVFVAVVSTAMLLRAPGLASVVFIPGVLTNLVFANVGLQGRLRLTARLRESNQSALRELTDRKRAEVAVARANKELEAFSYSVAHDLRAPLRAINGFSSILVEDYGPALDPEAQRYLGRIQLGAERMGHLIDALLGLARVTRKDLKRDAVDLSELARAVVQTLQAGQPERTVTFAAQAGVVAQGDAELLRAVFDNLIGNAWKFTRRAEAPRIAFGATQRGGVPTYFVEDNGAGFDMEKAGQMFAPFRRFHAEGDFEGTGIGLATVQRIVDRHGGKIWAESTVGKGATFFFTLQPASAPAPH